MTIALFDLFVCSAYSDAVTFYTSGSCPSQPDPPMLSEQFVKALTISWIKRPNDDEFTLQMEDYATVRIHIQKILLINFFRGHMSLLRASDPTVLDFGVSKPERAALCDISFLRAVFVLWNIFKLASGRCPLEGQWLE